MRKKSSKILCGDTKNPVTQKMVKDWLVNITGKNALVRVEMKVIIDEKESKTRIETKEA